MIQICKLRKLCTVLKRLELLIHETYKAQWKGYQQHVHNNQIYLNLFCIQMKVNHLIRSFYLEKY